MKAVNIAYGEPPGSLFDIRCLPYALKNPRGAETQEACATIIDCFRTDYVQSGFQHNAYLRYHFQIIYHGNIMGEKRP